MGPHPLWMVRGIRVASAAGLIHIPRSRMTQPTRIQRTMSPKSPKLSNFGPRVPILILTCPKMCWPWRAKPLIFRVGCLTGVTKRSLGFVIKTCTSLPSVAILTRRIFAINPSIIRSTMNGFYKSNMSRSETLDAMSVR
eukprot:TCALIF_13502-PA protein Name:"Protein of unknown function" AED:0.00 eAED:0.00 QI:108/1/0.5/1/1/1/2/45/138